MSVLPFCAHGRTPGWRFDAIPLFVVLRSLLQLRGMTVGLILGGARSGKSRFAQEAALRLCSRPTYVATSRRWDDDHAARIARHRESRDPVFTTVEEEKRIARAAALGGVTVVDCVTLWLTNFFVDLNQDEEAALQAAREEFEHAIRQPNSTWLFVSNELGMGVHAPTEVGRKFVDLQGWMNQHIARHAHWVVLMVAGIPVPVKGKVPGEEPFS